MRKWKNIKRKVGGVKWSQLVSILEKWKKQKDNLHVPIREGWRTRATQLKRSKKMKNIKSTESKDNKNPKENEETKIFQRIKTGVA